MKTIFRSLALVPFLLSGLSVLAQTPLNTTLIGHLPYSASLSEVRGALHNGREYALVGVINGFSIVDLIDPANPVEVFFEPGQSSIWRDPFYHNGHAYCVNEGGDGLLMVDMSPLPAVTNLTTATYQGSTFPWTTAHNMFIDTITSRAYIFGSDNGVGGAIILDISSPMAPIELGRWNDHYIHDGYVRGDTLWAACLEAGVFLIDVSTPSNPVNITSWLTPSQFAHNVWPTDDNTHCFTTDEVNSGFVAAYSMADIQNVVETDKARHPLSEGVIPHNTHFFNNYVVTSHYRDGLTIHDVSDPTNMVLTGHYDTSPLSGGGFNGAWGAWPYLPSGNILVADIEEGLFIIGANYTQAARLEGTVTEFGTGNLLNGVQIEVVGASLNETTDIFGTYATGTATAGTYDVTFLKGGYLPQTVTGVVLINGATELLDVQLVPDVSFVFDGLVTDAVTGDPIEGATVQMVSQFFNLNLTTDAAGRYVDSTFFSGQYEVTVGAWGHVGQCTTLTVVLSDPAPDFQLTEGYHDDFALDLGWAVSGDAITGIWVRDIPNGTDFNGTPANPSEDALGDCGGHAFVTGNAIGAVNIDDVDDGMTILTSPGMDLTVMTDPQIRFEYWFFNQGGNTPPNDEFIVKISNGIDVTTVASLPTTNDVWTTYGISVADHIALTDDMRMLLEVQDVLPGHLVEAGIDVFRVVETTGIGETASDIRVSLYPNPATATVNIQVFGHMKDASVQLRDVAGRAVSPQRPLGAGINALSLPKADGIYLCEVVIDGQRQVHRLVVHQ